MLLDELGLSSGPGIFNPFVDFTSINNQNDILVEYGSEEFELTPVTEPSSIVLMLTAFLLFLGGRRIFGRCRLLPLPCQTEILLSSY
jgi:hypothetical protein